MQEVFETSLPPSGRKEHLEEPQEESEEASLEQTRSPEYSIAASTDEVGIQAIPT